VFFAAAVYLALKHAINLNEDNLRVSPVKRVFVTIFIVMDTITTIVQVAGAALVSSCLVCEREKNEEADDSESLFCCPMVLSDRSS